MAKETANAQTAREDIYSALVERARSGRMGQPLTFADYQSGLLGPEWRHYAAQASSRT